MIQAMLSLIAGIQMYSGGGPITSFEIVLIILAFVAFMLVGACWDIVNMLVKRFLGRNWPAASAVVDIVSVAFMEDDSPIPHLKVNANTPYYLATLTYSYRYPDPQMGDYKRRFGDKDEAESWANSYKGETVKIHVNPRDPTRSVLREEDL